MNKKERQTLKQASHGLKPVVILGAAGLTSEVQQEIDLALSSHELIKIRVNAASREERQQMITDICQQQQATLINQIGHVVVIYREQIDPT